MIDVVPAIALTRVRIGLSQERRPHLSSFHLHINSGLAVFIYQRPFPATPISCGSFVPVLDSRFVPVKFPDYCSATVRKSYH